MGELKVTINKNQRVLELYRNDVAYTSLIRRLTDYFQENISKFEGYDIAKVALLKSVIIGSNVPVLDEIFDILESENEWTLEYSGKVISLEDKETGVKYSHVIVICAYFNKLTHELGFLMADN